MRVRLTVTGRAGYSMGSVHGRWTGKPVRIRRGPATVTGEAHRTRPQAAATGHRSASREGAGGSGPEARRPPSDPSRSALAERGGSTDEDPNSRRPRRRPRQRSAARGAGRRRARHGRPPDRGTLADAVRGSASRTDVRPFQFTGDPATHQCDGTTTGGTSPQPVPTRGAAVVALVGRDHRLVVRRVRPELLDGRGRVRRVRCRHGALSGRVQERCVRVGGRLRGPDPERRQASSSPTPSGQSRCSR